MADSYKNLKYVVYMHISPNGKKYVGITCRKPEYRFNNGKNYKHNRHFYRAIVKYGWEHFEHKILYEDLSFDDACEKEKEIIQLYSLKNPKNGYNKTDGGEGVAGFTLTVKQKKALSARVKAMHDNGWCPVKGWHNPHFRNADGEVDKAKTKPISDYAISQKTYLRFAKHVEECKKTVNQYDLNGCFICTHESITAAAKAVNGNKQNIYGVCNRKTNYNGSQNRTYKGFQWRYSNDCKDVFPVKDLRPRLILQIDHGGNIVGEYNSCREAMMKTGIHKAGISGCCRLKQKTAGGFIWRYK